MPCRLVDIRPDWVREVREATGLTWRDFARRADISVGTMSHMQRGLHCPTETTIRKINSVLAYGSGRILIRHIGQ